MLVVSPELLSSSHSLPGLPEHLGLSMGNHLSTSEVNPKIVRENHCSGVPYSNNLLLKVLERVSNDKLTVLEDELSEAELVEIQQILATLKSNETKIKNKAFRLLSLIQHNLVKLLSLPLKSSASLLTGASVSPFRVRSSTLSLG